VGRVNHLLAAVFFLLGLALLPAVLTGRLPGSLAGPIYVTLFSATVLVGWLGQGEGHPAVPATAAGVLAGGLSWGFLEGTTMGDPGQAVAGSWSSTVSAFAIETTWPLLVAIPAGLVVLVGVARGEGPLPTEEGTRGRLEDLPGRADLFGVAALGLGVAGTLFAGSTLLEKVAVVAPIFEEYAKLGVALLVLAALGLSSGASAYALGMLSGLAFGLLEHAVTYPGESQLMHVVRGLFHGLAAGLSGLVYVRLRDRELAPGTGWFAIVPAAIVHAANNVSAVFLAFAHATRTLPSGPVSETFSLVFVLALLALAVRVWVRPGPTVDVIEEWWHRLNGEIDRPRVLKAGP
jgi:hypothetical protein